MSELTPDQIDCDATDLIADGAVISAHYAFTQIVSAKLWRDEAQRASFVAFMARQPTPGYVRTDDAHREAASFGQLVHANDCQYGLSVEDDDTGVETRGACSDDCVILPSSEADATLVLIRVEVNVRKVDDEQ